MVAGARSLPFDHLPCIAHSHSVSRLQWIWWRVSQVAPRAEVESDPDPPKKKTALLLMADSTSDDEALSNKSLERYRTHYRHTVQECPLQLQWWSTHAGAYGELVPVAQRHLATLASTVPCERLFLMAGHIVHKKRSSLTSENVIKLVCLSNLLTEK